ncbi:HECT type ubiquitin ligase, partial [Reticulomyxa filosa]
MTQKSLKIEYRIRRNIYDPTSHHLCVHQLEGKTIVIANDNPVYIAAQLSKFDQFVDMTLLTLPAHQSIKQESKTSAERRCKSNEHILDNNYTKTSSAKPLHSSSQSSVESKIVDQASKSNSHQFPSSFLGEVAKITHAIESYYNLVGPRKRVILAENQEIMAGKPCPTGGISEIVEFTVMFWIHLDDGIMLRANGKRNILRKGDHENKSLLPWIYFAGSNSNITLQVQVITKADNTISLSHSMKVSSGHRWRHVTVTGNSFVVKLYVGGKLVKKHRTDGPLKHNSDPIYIGKCPPGVEYGFKQQQQQQSPNERSMGMSASLLDCRYYLRCLSQKEIETYTAEANVVGKPNYSYVQFRHQIDPSSKTKISLDYFQKATQLKLPEFDPWRWIVGGSSVETSGWDHEVIMLFEGCYQETASQEFRSAPNHQDNRDARNALRSLLPADIIAHSLHPNDAQMERYVHLNGIAMQTLKRRHVMLQMLNHKIRLVLPLIDFAQVGLNWSLASRLCALRSLIFHDLKRQPWKTVLYSTSSSSLSSPKVTVNRLKALQAREKAATGRLQDSIDALKMSTFGQIAISADLQSSHLQLFVKCPNSRGYGENQEQWLPNPSCNSSLHLSMFTFIGKLMGMMIRSKHHLNLDLSSFVWKLLVGKQVTREDLCEVNSLCFGVLDKLANIKRFDITPENFHHHFPCYFVANSCDGRQVLLKTNGDKIQ